MDWLKKHYDGLALLIASLLAIGLGAVVFGWVSDFEEEFSERNSQRPPDGAIRDAAYEALQEAYTAIEKPAQWGGHDGSLLASRIYVLRGETLIDPIEGDTPLHPPVPNEWLLKYDLDYSQRDILETDADGDGFTVLEEWMAGTDPTDPDSVPPYWTRLRLVEFERVPFKVKFSGSPDGGETFTINFIDDRTIPTQFVELGDTINIAGLPYRVVQYESIQGGEEQFFRDLSELTLEAVDGSERIVLVNNEIVDSPTMFGTFLNLLDGEQIKVKKGDEFALAVQPENKFRLEELTEAEAKILEVETGKTHAIPSE